jgi:HK97 family phage portal protein
MGRLQKAAINLISAMRFTAYNGSRLFRQMLPDERDYLRLVGDGTGNSIVSACILWIARTFPEAPPMVWDVDENDIRTRLPRHPLVQLLKFPTASPDKPGGYYPGTLLWMATLTSWIADGNAYWMKVRSSMGRVVQLWYVPHWMMEPRWPTDGSAFISHYDYRVDGQVFPIAPSEVVHFRHGLDPDNTRKGKSPLSTLLREVFTDEEAARFSASMLKNLGVPGLVVAPAPSQQAIWRPEPDDVKAIKAQFKQDYTGDRRGEPIVMSGPTIVSQFGFSPVQMDLTNLRHLPEERVTAVLGIPAAVVGLGAGIRHTKVGATMHELRDQAWQSNLIPTQRLMGAEIQTQLLPDFEGDLMAHEFGFDTSRVKVLQDDQEKKATTWSTLMRSGIAKRSEARSAFELPSGPEDDVYLPQPGVQAGADGSNTAPGGGSSGGEMAEQNAAAMRIIAAQVVESSK